MRFEGRACVLGSLKSAAAAAVRSAARRLGARRTWRLRAEPPRPAAPLRLRHGGGSAGSGAGADAQAALDVPALALAAELGARVGGGSAAAPAWGTAAPLRALGGLSLAAFHVLIGTDPWRVGEGSRVALAEKRVAELTEANEDLEDNFTYLATFIERQKDDIAMLKRELAISRAAAGMG
jgi:hypothetical protein